MSGVLVTMTFGEEHFETAVTDNIYQTGNDGIDKAVANLDRAYRDARQWLEARRAPSMRSLANEQRRQE